jgi:demethylmenaquinone methyltransferase / 2-methoxy-6-polyprenyl-1,4-benzoquinol methylase
VSNTYYQSGDQRAARVNELFNRIARQYDLINDIQSLGLHRIWKKWLWLLAQPEPDAKVLDLCCGTGDIAFLFAEKCCAVTAIDFSEPMLEVARQRQLDRPCNRHVEFAHGDAMNTGLPDNSFDYLTIGYGLRNLSDYGAALAEMKRLLKPGGQLLVLEFGKPDGILLRGAYYAYLMAAVPIFGKIFCGDKDAYAYILESLKNYPAQRGVNDLLEVIGFENTRIMNFFGGTMSINSATKPIS